MTAMLQWLAALEWTSLVKALLHTLWQGAVFVLLLGWLFRRTSNPTVRYRAALGAMIGVLLAGLITWAVLNRPRSRPVALASEMAKPTAAAASITHNYSHPMVVKVPSAESKPAEMGWAVWLGLFWLAGVLVMTGRAGVRMAGAERLRRSSRPLDDTRISKLLAEARQAVGLARRVRLAATKKLTSPAVVGVLVPTLVLPLSLITTLAPEQIRFVLLHELAHIRRGDYFANLFQEFMEALLFFNPAIWWISRQMRIEREACCDALAIEASGAPMDYARTLVRVAESVLDPAPEIAPALGDRREPSSLADRVQRMLVPGYRPKLRLTWRAMFAVLLTGGALLFLSALGTRVTVAAILSPQQRIEQIEKKMAEYGEPPRAWNYGSNDEQVPKITVSGHVRTADGSQVPKWIWLNVNSSISQSSYGVAVPAKNGFFKAKVHTGSIYIAAEVTNYAPAIIGPLDGLATNRIENLELVCKRGFDVPLQLVDADNGKPVTGARATTMFWMNNHGLAPRTWAEDASDSMTLTHCADLPMTVTVNAPGYEIIRKRFDHLHPGEPLRIKLRRGEIANGTVVDASTGRGLAGSTLRLVYEKGRTEGHYEWTDPMELLAKTDTSGRFTINQLLDGTRYWIGVSAPGHESAIVSTLTGGDKNAVIKLGPELVVHGHVIGDLNSLRQIDHHFTLDADTSEVFGRNSYGNSQWVPLHDTNEAATFTFTNRVAGKVTLVAGDRNFVRNVNSPVNDWVINLNVTNPPVQPREVILRFQSPSGVAPKGTVYVTVPYRMSADNPAYQRKELEIRNGEVHARTFVGAYLSYEPAHTIGFWFKEHWSQPIPPGTSPLVIDVPVVPAGTIFARAKNADGSPAGGLFFSVEELKRSPLRNAASSLSDNSDSVSGNAPRQWVSGPLPLEGTYEIVGWRGNSFCISRPIKLTEAQPDAEVDLQFPPGRSFTGTVRDAGGQPIRDGAVGVEFILPSPSHHSFGLKSVFTDNHGRFQVDGVTSGAGKYIVTVSSPGFRSEMFDVDFSRLPMHLRLQRGLTLAGQVVEARTGDVIPDAEIRVITDHAKLPSQTARTDNDGRFEFTTLGDATYRMFVDSANFPRNANNRFKAGQTNLVVKVTPYPGSRLARRLLEKKDLDPKEVLNNSHALRLFARNFKVNTNIFLPHLIKQTGVKTNVAVALKRLLYSAGVEVKPPKAVFYNERLGAVFVRATMRDLDKAESVIARLNDNQIVSQIHIKARFLEVPTGTLNGFAKVIGITNQSRQIVGILPSQNAKMAIRALQSRSGVEELAAPEVTTTSGRQTEIRATVVQNIMTNFVFRQGAMGRNSVIPQTTRLETGPILDTVATVLPDNYTIDLRLAASRTEFVGYDKPPTNLVEHINDSGDVVTLPVILPILQVSKADAHLKIWDRQTVVMRGVTTTHSATVRYMKRVTAPDGGLTVESPVYREQVTPTKKQKELLVLITVTLVDRVGNRIHSDDEMPSAKDAIPVQDGS